jgi:hypothetical protein
MVPRLHFGLGTSGWDFGFWGAAGEFKERLFPFP